jgi:cysteinyl-tRNA synthetase
MSRRPPVPLAVALALMPLAWWIAAPAHAQTPARDRLRHVTHWFYYLDVDLDDDTLDQIAASTYDLVVIDPIVTETDNQAVDIAGIVEAIQASGNGAGQSKLVLAYLDIGQAESYRTYWDDDWEVGDPAWIAGEDPDGWAENYPVAYWYDDWQAIWFDGAAGSLALLQLVLDAGFDGVYLDWVEAYDDENVIAIADADGVDAVEEMIWFVQDISAFLKDQDEAQIVIAQNAAELAAHEVYRAAIDGIAQEQIWFDGGADGAFAEGDCPLPATEADIDSAAYAASLSPPCRALYDAYPDSTLHVSSEWYIDDLTRAQARGVFILTVDYALAPENVAVAYSRSRALGFVPFVGPRSLDRFIPLYP